MHIREITLEQHLNSFCLARGQFGPPTLAIHHDVGLIRLLVMIYLARPFWQPAFVDEAIFPGLSILVERYDRGAGGGSMAITCGVS